MSPLGRGFQRVQRREAAKLHVLQTTTHIGVLGKKKGGAFDVEAAISSALGSEETEQNGSAVTFRALNFSSGMSRNLPFWDHT